MHKHIQSMLRFVVQNMKWFNKIFATYSHFSGAQNLVTICCRDPPGKENYYRPLA